MDGEQSNDLPWGHQVASDRDPAPPWHSPEPDNDNGDGDGDASPVDGAQAEANRLIDHAGQVLTDARREAERILGDARDRAAQLIADANDEVGRVHSDAQRAQAEGQRALAEARETAAQLLTEATSDAGTARADAQRALADGQRALDEARDEARRTVEDARRDADRVVTEAENEAAKRRQETESDIRRTLADATMRAQELTAAAEAESHRMRQEASDEAHRTRTQADTERSRLLSEARTLAEADTARRVAEAEEAAAQIRDAAEMDRRRLREEAEVEAHRVRETAELDRVHVLEEARAQAYYEATRIRDEGARQARQSVLRVPSTITPIHSAEVTAREFPRAWRGLDAQTVSKWLVLVEQSYTLLEDELDRRRAELDELFDAFGQIRRRLTRAASLPEGAAEDELEKARAAWNRALEVAGGSVSGSRLGFDTLVVRTALLDTPLRRRLFGYSRDQVRRLLETSASQMARLENQLHLIHAENERLRSVFIEQLVETTGWDGDQRVDGEIRSLRRPDDQRDA